MDTLTHASINALLISCVLSAGISLPSQAGDGVIVTGRTVQGHMYGRTSRPDPYPTTANANPSKAVISATSGELSDVDIGSVSSGSSLARSIQPNGHLPGLGTTQNSMSTVGATGAAAGHGAGSGMGGQISDSIQRGMAPLNTIGGMLGGK
ncbi:hypothetical protein [Pseudomonas sp.]|uniref:hypothetical protein n=1 Tax=Pseudomonas sp. TaxID=306 RepID=UPI00261BC6A8|nr:hypothetical protein [Pseudomonas sp.]